MREGRIGDFVSLYGNRISAALWYSRNTEGSVDEVEIELVDVRAADAIRITYDFGRDGYVIKQAAREGEDEHGNEQDEGWAEVAFVPAWSRWEAKP